MRSTSEPTRAWASAGAIVLVLVTLAGRGVVVAWAAGWHVRRQLRPLKALAAADPRHLGAQRLDQRLSLADPAEELLPWIEQFNALMQRLEQAYAQLEGFNADVAHELRTPLATLIGETELALSRERSAGSLKETLASNLEEMQRLSGMVNDMLFLASVDRGAVARRGEPVSLAALAHQVAEFHEVPLDEAGLRLEVQGDARLAVDEPLVKRALSNLLGNATRFAERGSTVRVRIADEAPNRWPSWSRTGVRASRPRPCPGCSTASSGRTARVVAMGRGSTMGWAWPSWLRSRACMPAGPWPPPRRVSRGWDSRWRLPSELTGAGHWIALARRGAGRAAGARVGRLRHMVDG
jgi:signal transduction histidine kinase